MARNNVLVPESKKAMDAFKMEVANSLNVNLKQGYNGDLTSREAGSIGGEMVKRTGEQLQQGVAPELQYGSCEFPER